MTYPHARAQYRSARVVFCLTDGSIFLPRPTALCVLRWKRARVPCVRFLPPPPSPPSPPTPPDRSRRALPYQAIGYTCWCVTEKLRARLSAFQIVRLMEARARVFRNSICVCVRVCVCVSECVCVLHIFVNQPICGGAISTTKVAIDLSMRSAQRI